MILYIFKSFKIFLKYTKKLMFQVIKILFNKNKNNNKIFKTNFKR